MKTRARVLLIALLAVAGGCDGGDPASERTDSAVAELPVVHQADPPAIDGAFAPELWADEVGLILTWLEPLGETRADGHRLRVAQLVDSAWSEPVTVAEGRDLFANWADVPAAARAADGTLYSHWLAKTAEETYAYSIFLARSADGGASWEAIGKLNDDETDTEHGFVSWVREAEGLRAFWLDGREMAEGGPMNVRSASVGAGGIGESELLDDRVCECCTTDAGVSASGSYVVYRDRGETEARDTYLVSRTETGWSAPRAVHQDGWTIEGCPVNGPETDADGDLAVTAWFTAAGDRAQVRAALSSDGGASFGEPAIIDDEGALGRVDTVLDGDGGALVSWLTGAGERADVKLVRLAADGSLGEPLTVAETSSARASGFPRLVRRADSAYLAWVDLEPDQPSRLLFREIPTSAIP